tara:strand:+ start:5635 stop:7470 length:1836 start_codon:yes stop_codon:yes gene_type:complete
VGRLTFLAPIAGLIAGAIGAGLVLVMYMLRLRRRPVLVSSILLWKRAVKDLEGNIPWQRLSPTALFFLHLLIVALLALALARPVMDTSLADGQRVAIVIDSSASMNASVGEKSLIDIAKENARDRVRALFDSGRSPRVTVIDAGLEPRVVIRDSAERGRLLASIDSINATDQPGDVSVAIELIERLDGRVDEESERVDTLVWVFSDGGGFSSDSFPLSGASGLLVPSVPEGAALRNLGIVALSAQRDRVDTELCRVFVRLIRSATGPSAGVVRVFEGEDVIDSAPVSFEDDQATATHSFEIRLMRSSLLRVEIVGDDAFAIDNRAWVSVPGPDPVRVTIVAPEGRVDPLLLDSIEVVARTPAMVVSPGDPMGSPNLIVFDRVDVEMLPGVPSVGFGSVIAPYASRMAPPTSARRMLSWDRNDPTLRDAGIGGMAFVRSIRFDEAISGLRVLARDQDGAAIAEIADRGNRHLRAAFALHDSDWSVQVGFTIFMAQVFESLLPGAGGQGEVFRTNELIVYRDDDGIERVVGPIGSIGETTVPDGRVVGVSLLSDDESALQTRSTVTIGNARESMGNATLGRVRVDLWRWFVLGAIVLLLIEWVLYLRKVRVSI